MSSRARFDALVSPLGVISRVSTEPLGAGVKSRWLGLAHVGNRAPRRVELGGHVIKGSGIAGSDDAARFLAIAEGLERYAGTDILGEERVWASAAELGGECLSPERYPRCSDREYAHPACPVSRFDPAVPIRWVRGLDLIAGEDVWVPAAMACYGMARVDAERFTATISTGYAVHTDPIEAVLRGVCEVIERDMIALVWLQRMALPRIDLRGLPGSVADVTEWCRRRFIAVHLFDATSDLGVPTAYAVLQADHDRRASRVVGAGTGRDPGQAAQKALEEALRTSRHLARLDGGPVDFAEFTATSDGALYMGRAEHSAAFAFLLEGERPTSTGGARLADDPDTALAQVVGELARAGMRPVVVDRTPQELRDVGMTAVCAVIPDLQPMSVHPLAQFTAHARLYTGPARMGYRVLTEEELNPWPQPFA